jgi:oxygen-dependent protoporphyrinogen oxidase
MLAERFIAPGKQTDNESLYEFGKRRFGVQSAETLFDVMAKGVFGGNPKELGVASAFPRLVELERQHGSLIKGMMVQRKKGGLLGTLMAPKGGMSEITDTLSLQLGESLKLNTKVLGIKAAKGGFMITTQNNSGESGETLSDVVVSALPPEVLRGLEGIKGSELGRALKGASHAPIATVSLGFERSQVEHPLDGFGLLCPTREKQPFMGVIWSSSVFPRRAPKDRVLLRAMVGGSQSPTSMELDDDEMEALVVSGLKALIGVKGRPCFRRIYRWSPGLPQYGVDHVRWIQGIEACQSSYPGLFITGNGFRGVGMGDCVTDAFQVVDKIKGPDERV